LRKEGRKEGNEEDCEKGVDVVGYDIACGDEIHFDAVNVSGLGWSRTRKFVDFLLRCRVGLAEGDVYFEQSAEVILM
jgi:hypothetical protein